MSTKPLDHSIAEEPAGQASPPPLRPVLLAAAALACLVWVVFFPIFGFQFIDLDVPTQITHNPYIRSLSGENLKHILTSVYLESYYPVRTLTYAVDYGLWGPDPAGFKLTNGLLHTANVLLVFWLLLRLFRAPTLAPDSLRPAWSVVAAASSAAIFAVHPVVVEPVTWVPGREELLVTLAALGSMHFHVWARRLAAKPANPSAVIACHAAVAVCCLAACLSNAVGAVIPLLLVAWDLLTLPPPRFRKILSGTFLPWAISLTTIVTKRLTDSADVPDRIIASLPTRLRLPPITYWRDLKALLWPTELSITYQWPEPQSFLDVEFLFGVIAIGLSIAAVWFLRQKTLAVFGLLWFAVSLGPALQIMPQDMARADRFLYLPLVGLAIVAAAGLRQLGDLSKGRASPAAAIGVVGLVLLLLVALSAVQVRQWRTRVSLWQHCVNVDPTNPMAHLRLAENLTRQGQVARAIQHYEFVLAPYPNVVPALNKLALLLATRDEVQLRDYDRAVKLASRACRLTEWKDPTIVHTLAMAHNNAAVDLEHRGRFASAIEHYRKAIDVEPDYEDPLFNLALLLATCSDHQFRRNDEAVRLAERACRLIRYADPKGLWVLAVTYAQAGRYGPAADTIQKALQMVEAAGNEEQAGQLRGQLQHYRDRIPSGPPGN